MTSDGLPDFEAVLAAGGKVQGAIPPTGSPMVQHVNQFGNAIQIAAMIDLGDGSAPFLLKGNAALTKDTTSQGPRQQLLSILEHVLAELPNNIEQARAWVLANNWPTYDNPSYTNSPTRLDATV